MSRKLLPLFFTTALLGGTASADVPNVAVDIAPVHSLVSRVMEGVGTPSLVIPAGASPHEYSLRPSEAAALQNAEIVFWIGEQLTPWLADALATLAEAAELTELLDADGTLLLDVRENAAFETHSHGHEDHEGSHDAHAEDHDHDHGEHAEGHGNDHEEHAESHDHDHDHGAHDPHAWLSPENGRIWLNFIAAELSAADPENAGIYFANAATAISDLDALRTEIDSILDPVRGGRFIVFHDAFQYFEASFEMPASGAISLSDAAAPSPARIAEIQARIQEDGISCVLSEPQFDPGIVSTVMESTAADTAVIDPLGSNLELGAALYTDMLRNLATSLAECLEG